ncbi:MAG: transcription-repair coupling factor [Planctomyces sp.]|nr:transcription-repair coupling factor [Planctomyces sp.]
MPLKGVLSTVNNHPGFSSLVEGIGGEGAPPQITARQGAAPVYIGALWERHKVPMLVITPRPEDARRLHDQLLTYLGEDEPVYLLPEPEVLPFERLAVDANTSNQRLEALAALALSRRTKEDPAQTSPIVVTSINAALRPTLPPNVMSGGEPDANNENSWKIGERVRLNELLVRWVELGYRSEPVVETPGTFSHRGGIIDIFPSQADLPFRIELWDDQIDTIRTFDPRTQRSVDTTESVSIIPAREQLPNVADRNRVEKLVEQMDFSRCDQEIRERIEDELVTLFSAPNVETLSFYNGLLNQTNLLDYLRRDGLVVLERPSLIEGEAQELEERFVRMRSSREERGEMPQNFPAPSFTWEEFSKKLETLSRLHLHSWLSESEDALFHPAVPYYGRLEQLANDAKRYASEGKAIVAVTQNGRRLAEILDQEGVTATLTSSVDEPPQAGGIYLITGALREGWTLESSAGNSGADGVSLVLLTDAELFGSVKERRSRRRHTTQPGNQIATLTDMVAGSYVVHIDHGVARFSGTTRMGDGDEDKEYLVLEYAENDKLYVPTEHLDRVTSYVGAQDQPPSLTRLGSAEWARIKEKVKGATREMAQELLNLHASRQIAQGHEFSQDTVWQQELEDSFPFEETPDQATAISDVKTDMEQLKPMDRLICGDVGYGKTEVALRAAFKTVYDGMQVGVLVPTTVLAQQHYATFSERLSPFPISVDVLSRFRTNKEQQEVLENLRKGNLDIVIGTHRLLQKDVSFKNLGLAVVDEEQRFGVAHKERLKQLRKEVDVLTLSATPIPRTLNQALAGIRDLSTMDTPPEARLPVKTFVSEYSEDLIKEAILREMERGGQIFFLHNRVRTIERTALELQELVPQARILIGHGQMAENELEDVMVAFSSGEADILVCTTIIESGLDLPNVNTLILDRADRFGLSQLYQLRGRIGRGEHRAYAYMLVPRGRRVTEAAERRLQAILEASELGSGFRIAMRDLEIRGAGNLLGSSQSGHIREVGLDLYSQLLKEAVAEMQNGQGGEISLEAEFVPDLPRMELPLPAHIPEDYIPHMPSRLSIYQRVARLKDRSDVPALRQELRDRFGPTPEEVENMLTLADFRASAGGLGIDSILQNSDGFALHLKTPVGGAKIALQRALGPSVNVGNQQINLPARNMGDEWLPRLTRMVGRFRAFQDRLQSLAG